MLKSIVWVVFLLSLSSFYFTYAQDDVVLEARGSAVFQADVGINGSITADKNGTFGELFVSTGSRGFALVNTSSTADSIQVGAILHSNSDLVVSGETSLIGEVILGNGSDYYFGRPSTNASNGTSTTISGQNSATVGGDLVFSAGSGNVVIQGANIYFNGPNGDSQTTVQGSVQISQNTNLSGNALIGGTLSTPTDASANTLQGSQLSTDLLNTNTTTTTTLNVNGLMIDNTLSVSGTANVSGTASSFDSSWNTLNQDDGSLVVSIGGVTSIRSLNVSGNASVFNDARTSSQFTAGGDLSVAGDSTISGNSITLGSANSSVFISRPSSVSAGATIINGQDSGCDAGGDVTLSAGSSTCTTASDATGGSVIINAGSGRNAAINIQPISGNVNIGDAIVSGSSIYFDDGLTVSRSLQLGQSNDDTFTITSSGLNIQGGDNLTLNVSGNVVLDSSDVEISTAGQLTTVGGSLEVRQNVYANDVNVSTVDVSSLSADSLSIAGQATFNGGIIAGDSTTPFVFSRGSGSASTTFSGQGGNIEVRAGDSSSLSPNGVPGGNAVFEAGYGKTTSGLVSISSGSSISLSNVDDETRFNGRLSVDTLSVGESVVLGNAIGDYTVSANVPSLNIRGQLGTVTGGNLVIDAGQGGTVALGTRLANTISFQEFDVVSNLDARRDVSAENVTVQNDVRIDGNQLVLGSQSAVTISRPASSSSIGHATTFSGQDAQIGSGGSLHLAAGEAPSSDNDGSVTFTGNNVKISGNNINIDAGIDSAVNIVSTSTIPIQVSAADQTTSVFGNLTQNGGSASFGGDISAASLSVGGTTYIRTGKMEADNVDTTLFLTSNNLYVDGYASLGAVMAPSIQVAGDFDGTSINAGSIDVDGSQFVGGSFNVTGEASLISALYVESEAFVGEDLNVRGSSSIGTLSATSVNVAGNALFQDLSVENISISGELKAANLETSSIQANESVFDKLNINSASSFGSLNIFGDYNNEANPATATSASVQTSTEVFTLSISGVANVLSDAVVLGNTNADGLASVSNQLIVGTKAELRGSVSAQNVQMDGDSTVQQINAANGNVQNIASTSGTLTTGTAQVRSLVAESNEAIINNSLSVSVNTIVNGNLEQFGSQFLVDQDLDVSSDLSVTGNVIVSTSTSSSSLIVNNSAQLSSANAEIISADSLDAQNITVKDSFYGDSLSAASVNVDGNLKVNQDLSAASLSVQMNVDISGDATANQLSADKLVVEGYTTLSGNIELVGNNPQIVGSGYNNAAGSSLSIFAQNGATGGTLDVSAGYLDVTGGASANKAGSVTFTSSSTITLNGQSGVVIDSGYGNYLSNEECTDCPSDVASSVLIGGSYAQNINIGSLNGNVSVASDLRTNGYLSSQNVSVQGDESKINGDLSVDTETQSTNFASDKASIQSLNVAESAASTMLFVNDTLSAVGISNLANTAVDTSANFSGSLLVTRNVAVSGNLSSASLSVRRNQDVDGSVLVSSTAQIYELSVTGSTSTSNLVINGQFDSATASFDRDVTVTGNGMFDGPVDVQGDIQVSSGLCVGNDAIISDLEAAASDAALNGNLGVNGNTIIAGPVTARGSARIGSTTDVSGPVTANTSAVTADLNAASINANTLEIFDDAVLGNTNVNGNLLTQGGVVISGALSTQGNLTSSTSIVSGASSVGSLSVSSESTIDGSVQIVGNAYVVGNLNAAQSVSVAGSANIGEETAVAGYLVASSANIEYIKTEGDAVLTNVAVQNTSTIKGDASVGGNVDLTNGLSTATLTVSEGVTAQSLNVAHDAHFFGGLNGSGSIVVDSALYVQNALNILGSVSAQSTDVANSANADSLTQNGDATFGNTVTFSGDVNTDQLNADKDIYVSGIVTATNINSAGDVSGESAIAANNISADFLAVYGPTDISSTLNVEGQLSVGCAVSVCGPVSVGSYVEASSGLCVCGDANVAGDVLGPRLTDVQGELNASSIQVAKSNVRGSTIVSDDAVFNGDLLTPGNVDSGTCCTSISGSLTTNTLSITENATVAGRLKQEGTTQTSGDTTIIGNLDVSQSSQFSEVIVSGDLNTETSLITEDTLIQGSTTIYGDLIISGEATLRGEFTVQSSLTVDNGLFNATTSAQDLKVARSTLVGNLTVFSDAKFTDPLTAGSVLVRGDARSDSLSISGSSSIANDLSAKTAIFPNLNVNQNSHIDRIHANQINANGNVNVGGDVTVNQGVSSDCACVEELLANNLNVASDVATFGLKVQGSSTILGSLGSEGSIDVLDDATFQSSLNTTDVSVYGDVTARQIAGSSLAVFGELTVEGEVSSNSLSAAQDISAASLTLASDLSIDNADICCSSTFGGDLSVSGRAMLESISAGSLSVGRDAVIDEDLLVGGTFSANTNLLVGGNIYADSLSAENVRASSVITARVGALNLFSGSVTVENTTITTNLSAATFVNLGNINATTTSVNGRTDLNGQVNSFDSLAVSYDLNSRTLSVSEGAQINGDLSVGKLVVQDLGVSGLTQVGSASIENDVSLTGNASISSDLQVSQEFSSEVINADAVRVGSLSVGSCGATFGGSVGVTGSASVSGGLSTTGTLNVARNAVLSGFLSTSDIASASSISADMASGSDFSISGNLYSSTLSSTNQVTEGSVTSASTSVSGSITAQGSFSTTGDSNLASLNLEAGHVRFSCPGDVSVCGTLAATQNATFASDLNSAGPVIVDGHSTVAGQTTQSGAFNGQQDAVFNSLSLSSVVVGDVSVDGIIDATFLSTRNLTVGGQLSTNDLNSATAVISGNVAGAANLGVSGNLNANNLNIGSTTAVNGDVNVAFSATLNGNVNATGDFTTNGPIIAGPVSATSANVLGTFSAPSLNTGIASTSAINAVENIDLSGTLDAQQAIIYGSLDVRGNFVAPSDFGQIQTLGETSVGGALFVAGGFSTQDLMGTRDLEVLGNMTANDISVGVMFDAGYGLTANDGYFNEAFIANTLSSGYAFADSARDTGNLVASSAVIGGPVSAYSIDALNEIAPSYLATDTLIGNVATLNNLYATDVSVYNVDPVVAGSLVGNRALTTQNISVSSLSTGLLTVTSTLTSNILLVAGDLSSSGSALLAGELRNNGDLNVGNNVNILAPANVQGDIHIDQDFSTTGTGSFDSVQSDQASLANLDASSLSANSISIQGNLTVLGMTSTQSLDTQNLQANSISISEDATLGSLTAEDPSSNAGNAYVYGSFAAGTASFDSSLTIPGYTSVGGSATVDTNLNVQDILRGVNLVVEGDLFTSGTQFTKYIRTFYMNVSTLEVGDLFTQGNTVTGDATFAESLYAGGVVTIDGNTTIAAPLTATQPIAISGQLAGNKGLVIGGNLAAEAVVVNNANVQSLNSDSTNIFGTLVANGTTNVDGALTGLAITVDSLITPDLNTNQVQVTGLARTGYFQSSSSATVEGNAIFARSSQATVVNVGQNLNIGDSLNVGADLSVGSFAYFTADLTISQPALFDNNLNADVRVLSSVLNINGDSEIGSINSASAGVVSSLDANDGAKFGSVQVNGQTNFFGSVVVSNCNDFTSSGPFTAGEGLSVDGVEGVIFDGDVSARNVYIGSDLSAAGPISLSGSITRSTLSVAGESTLSSLLDAGSLNGNSGEYTFNGNSVIEGALTIRSDLLVMGNLISAQNMTTSVGGNLGVAQNADFNAVAAQSNVLLGSNLDVVGGADTNFGEELTVNGFTTVYGSLEVLESVFVGGQLCAAGAATFQSSVLANSSISSQGAVSGAGLVDVSGALISGGDVTINGNLQAIGANIDGSVLVDSSYFNTQNLPIQVAGSLSVAGTVTAINGNFGDLQVIGDFTGESMIVDTTTNLANTQAFGSFNVGGDITVDQGSSFLGNLNAGAVSVGSDLEVLDLSIFTDTTVGGNTYVIGDADVGLDASIGGEVTVNSQAIIGGDLSIQRDITLNGNLNVVGDATIDIEASILGNLNVDEDLTVGGTLRSASGIISGGVLSTDDVSNTGLVSVQGDYTNLGSETHAGSISIGGNSFLDGTLFVGASVAIQSDLSVVGLASLAGFLTVGTPTTTSNAHFTNTDPNFGSGFQASGNGIANSAASSGDFLTDALSLSGKMVIGPFDFSDFGGIQRRAIIDDFNFTDSLPPNSLFATSHLSKGDAEIQGSLTASNLFIDVEDTNVESNLTFGGNLTIDGSLSISGSLFSNTTRVQGNYFSEANETSFAGTLSVQGSITIESELTVEGSAMFDNFENFALSAADSVVTRSLFVQGSTTVGGTLFANADATVFGDLICVPGNCTAFIGRDLFFNETATVNINQLDANSLAVRNNSVFNAVSVNGDLSVSEDSSIGSMSAASSLINGNLTTEEDALTTIDNFDASINGDFTVRGVLSIGNLDTNTTFFVTMNLTNLNITSLADLVTDSSNSSITVDGTITADSFSSGVLNSGGIGFPYPGASDTLTSTSATTVEREPIRNLSECCAVYLVNYAPPEEDQVFYQIRLTGFTLNILNPGQTGTFVYNLISQLYDSGTEVYRYEVGDVVLLKGSPQSGYQIIIEDYEDRTDGSGNIYNGRNLLSFAMGSFNRILDSDEVFMYVYSPRPNSAEIQDTPIEWVRVGLGDINF